MSCKRYKNQILVQKFEPCLKKSIIKGQLCTNCNKSNHFANVCRTKIETVYTEGESSDDDYEKDKNILKGALLGAVGSLAAIGVGGLIAYGINESKVCYFFKYPSCFLS